MKTSSKRIQIEFKTNKIINEKPNYRRHGPTPAAHGLGRRGRRSGPPHFRFSISSVGSIVSISSSIT